MMPLENAILQTLAYSDIFDYPLTPDEIHRFLVVPASIFEVEESIALVNGISCIDGYYFLAGRNEIVELRKRREVTSGKVFKRAMFYGRIIGALPFVRMVALTGSLAMLNLSRNPDIDYMIIARYGRVWIARAFAILLGKFSRLFGDTICPNLIISERALEWPLHDLYSAHEFFQMIPISGIDLYLRLFDSNSWIATFLPNALPKTSKASKPSRFWRLGELPLQGVLGDKLESWEVNRKIKKFSAQPGFGAETVFTAEICQGNFNHHHQWTHDLYQERLSNLPERGLQSALLKRAD